MTQEWFNEPVPVKVPGVDIIFPSITACARYFGVHRTTVRGALERGTLDAIGTGNNTLKMKPVWVQNQDGGWDHYQSHADCARAFGLKIEVVSGFLRKMSDHPDMQRYHPRIGSTVRISKPNEE